MFGTAFGQIKGLFSQRFLRNAFLPAFIFGGLLLFLVVVTQFEIMEAFRFWENLPTLFKSLYGIAALAGLIFLAGLLNSQANSIIRLFEGYWNFPGGRKLQAYGKAWHRAHLQELDGALGNDPRRYEEIYLYYPLPTEPDEVLPTRLGNILKNAERYAWYRYKIDAVLIWPRLFYLLPEHFVNALSRARENLEFMLNIALVSGGFAVLGGLYLLGITAPWWLFLIVFTGGFGVAAAAYKAALGHALIYAQQIKTAFDLYRQELLKQLRLKLPASPEAERKQWEAVYQHFYRNVRPDADIWNYREG